MSRLAYFATIASLACFACNEKPASQNAPSSTPVTNETRQQQAPETSASAAISASAAPAAPPAPASGSEAERAAAVSHLISGEVSAAQLPVVATEPGETLDPSLRSTLSPVSRSRIRMGKVSVKGDLMPEIVQRILRRHYGRFRACYQRGLSQNPNLQGRITLQLAIAKDGTTATAKSLSSDLPDASVIRCVVSAVRALRYPKSDSGSVNVVSAPLVFSPE
jgi:hypothetical protein